MSGWYTPKPVVQNKGKQTSIDLSVLSRLRITLDCTPNDLLKHVLGNEDKAIRMALKGRVETPKRGQPKKEGAGEMKLWQLILLIALANAGVLVAHWLPLRLSHGLSFKEWLSPLWRRRNGGAATCGQVIERRAATDEEVV